MDYISVSQWNIKGGCGCRLTPLSARMPYRNLRVIAAAYDTCILNPLQTSSIVAYTFSYRVFCVLHTFSTRLLVQKYTFSFSQLHKGTKLLRVN